MCSKFVFFGTVVFCFLTIRLQAQDLILLNDGSEVNSKIIEIDQSNLYYKLFNQSGNTKSKLPLNSVFIVIYANGQRETFKTSTEITENLISTTKANKSIVVPITLVYKQFTVSILEAVTLPDIKKKWNRRKALIKVEYNKKSIDTLSISANHFISSKSNYNKPNGSYLENNYISVHSVKFGKYLFEKYENSQGIGRGWAISPDFFNDQSSSCIIKLIGQKEFNKEVLGFGGMSAISYNLQNCTSIDYRLLSVALIWMEANNLTK